MACSTVANSKALLKSAIRSDNPIIFFEHVLLYNVKGESIEPLQCNDKSDSRVSQNSCYHATLRVMNNDA